MSVAQPTKREIFLKEFLPPLVLTVVSAVIYIILQFHKDVFPHTAMCWAYVATILVPLALYLLFKFRMAPLAKILLYVFATLALLLANVFNFYSYWDNYDTFLHVLSGPLCCLAAMYILAISGEYKKMGRGITVVFCLGFDMGCGSFWEIVEYLIDTWGNSNSQHYVESGLMDTMGDILANAIGGFTFIAVMLVDLLWFHAKLTDKIFDSFTVYSKYDYRLETSK
jgi:hypothetical protein